MFWISALAAYFLGSVSFAIWLCSLDGLPDPRLTGSGNPGATNVFRSAGATLAILTLILDVTKGFLPALIARLGDYPPSSQLWIGLAAVAGHAFPIFFGFKGGKGVSTALGVVLAVSPIIAFFAAFFWVMTFKLTRVSSIASISGILLMGLVLPVYLPGVFLPVLALVVLLLMRHKQNVVQIWQGTESRL